jgi:hypothetical protein
MKLLAVIVGSIALACGLGGCAGPSVPPAHTTLAADRAGEVTLLALVAGELVLINNQCFGITTESGTFVAIFPRNSVSNGTGIDIAGLGHRELGEEIRGAGGFAHLEDVAEKIPDGCATDEVALFQVYP